MTITQENTDLAGAVEAMVPRLRELADQSEQQRWLADEAIELLGEAGMWHATVPKRFGGLELSLAEQMDALRQVARADGSLGWVSALWLANTWICSLYPDDAQDEIFAGGETRVSGAFTPTGTITPVDGGYLLNGSWKWNTGCRGAVWDGLAARLELESGPPEIFYCMAPTSELEIQDDWFAFGASATGSSEVRAKDVFIPSRRAMPLTDALAGTTGDRSNAGATGRNYAFFTYILVQAVPVFLGMAQGTYELFLDRLPGRGITYTPWNDQSASPVTHIQVATAANQIAAANALADVAAATLQRSADRGELPSIVERAELRGQAGFAADLCRQAVTELYNASGASVIMNNVPLQRFYRDVQGLSLHAAMLLNTNLEVHGRTIVGLEPGTPFI